MKNKDLNIMLKKPYLKTADITDLVIAYQKTTSQNKKQEYKDIIFSNVSRLIAKGASRHKSARIDEEDLFQSGVIGFCEALERFKPNMGNMFTTYLQFWIEKSMYNTLYSNNLIHTPRNVISYTNKEQKAELSGKKVKYSNLSKAFINTSNIVHLDGGVDGFHDSNLRELIRSATNIELDIERITNKIDLLNIMDKVLDIKEQQVLKMRYFDDGVMTLSDVGKYMNVSTERVRQIETIAIKKIRRRYEKRLI